MSVWTRSAPRLPTLAMIALGLFGFVQQTEGANWQSYTNTADFNGQLASSFFESFASLPPPGSEVSSPTNFSGNGFFFSAVTTSNHAPPQQASSLFSTTNRWLTLVWADDAIVLTNFSTSIRAVGGNFFGTTEDGTFQTAALNLVFSFVDASTLSTNISPQGTNSFYGLSFDTQLASLSIGADPFYATLDNVTVGTVVPEPAPLTLLLIAALGAIFAWRHKPRAQK